MCDNNSERVVSKWEAYIQLFSVRRCKWWGGGVDEETGGGTFSVDKSNMLGFMMCD